MWKYDDNAGIKLFLSRPIKKFVQIFVKFRRAHTSKFDENLKDLLPAWIPPNSDSLRTRLSDDEHAHTSLRMTIDHRISAHPSLISS